MYDKFVTKFENVVDEFAPMRKASRKENKLKCRPWLTSGLLKSIRIKNKMYNNLREKPDTSQSHKYKIYRNLLNRLIKQAKVDYYHNVLKDNKNNSKKVWNIVRRRHRLKGIHSRPDTNRTGAEGLSFYYPRLLHCLDQMLAAMLLSQHRVSSSKTVRPRAPCGARCMGHIVSTWSAVCSEAPHSQFGEGILLMN